MRSYSDPARVAADRAYFANHPERTFMVRAASAAEAAAFDLASGWVSVEKPPKTVAPRLRNKFVRLFYPQYPLAPVRVFG